MAKAPIRESRRGGEGILVRAQEANGEIRWPAYRLHTRGGWGGWGAGWWAPGGTHARARGSRKTAVDVTPRCRREKKREKKQRNR